MTSPSAPPDASPLSPFGLGGLLFQQPEEDQEESLSPLHAVPSPSTSPAAESPDLADDSPSPLEWEDEDGSADPSDAAPTSSKGSSRAEIASKRGLQATARNAIMIGSGMAHTFLAKTPGQKEVGLYLADDDDAKNIGDPVGSYMSRHNGVAGKLSEDAKDALDGLMGFGGFMAKQIARAQAAAQIDQHRAPAPVDEA
jgi:hypothetical protein